MQGIENVPIDAPIFCILRDDDLLLPRIGCVLPSPNVADSAFQRIVADIPSLTMVNIGVYMDGTNDCILNAHEIQ